MGLRQGLPLPDDAKGILNGQFAPVQRGHPGAHRGETPLKPAAETAALRFVAISWKRTRFLCRFFGSRNAIYNREHQTFCDPWLI
jgi:hypothetical protein